MPATATRPAAQLDYVLELGTRLVHILADLDGMATTVCGAHLTLREIAIHDELIDHDAAPCLRCELFCPTCGVLP